MGNWTDRFDPETVDRIKRCEVGEGDFLLAERLAMHKGVESVFGFHVNCLGLGKPYWEKGVYLGDVLDFFDRHGETLIEKRAGSWHGDSTEVAKASECLQKGLAQFGLTLAQARERYGKRDGDFYFVDDEYNPFVRHAPVKTMGSSTTRKTVIRRSTVTWIR